MRGNTRFDVPTVNSSHLISRQHGCQCFGSGFIDSRSESIVLGWIPIRIQGFDDQKLKKFTAEHPALQNMKFLNFFSIFVGHFCPPGSGFGIRIRWPDWIGIQNTDEYFPPPPFPSPPFPTPPTFQHENVLPLADIPYMNLAGEDLQPDRNATVIVLLVN